MWEDREAARGPGGARLWHHHFHPPPRPPDPSLTLDPAAGEGPAVPGAASARRGKKAEDGERRGTN